MNYLFLLITLGAIFLVLFAAVCTKLTLSNEQYDRLKFVVTKWDYIATFVGVIVTTFTVPYGAETVTIVVGIGAMLAGVLGVANANYKQSTIQTAFNGDGIDMFAIAEEFKGVADYEGKDNSAEEQ